MLSNRWPPFLNMSGLLQVALVRNLKQFGFTNFMGKCIRVLVGNDASIILSNVKCSTGKLQADIWCYQGFPIVRLLYLCIPIHPFW